MPRYDIIGTAPALIAANDPGPWGPRLLYPNATGAGIQNADGSRTFITGTGLVWNGGYDNFEAGTVTAINHYSAAGAYIDGISGASIAAVWAGGFFESDATNLLFEGNDVIEARFRTGNTVVDDTLNGYRGHDDIFAGTGNDRLLGGRGNDRLYGGDGNDRLSGDDVSFGIVDAAGNDTLDGGAGDDIMFGGGGINVARGGSGIDTLVIERMFADFAITAGGMTRLGYRFGPNDAVGTPRFDGIERIAADDGTYVMNAAGQWVRISGQTGLGTVAPSLVLSGTAGADDVSFYYTDVKRVYHARDGDDRVTFSLSGPEAGIALGGNGDDTLSSVGGGDVRLYGEAGDDKLTGGNRIDGGAGNDTITGASDADLTGGNGADVFNFAYFDGIAGGFPIQSGWGDIEILDFELSLDRLAITGDPEFTITQTADGLELSAPTSGPFGATGTTTILLRGLVAPGVTLDDLTLGL